MDNDVLIGLLSNYRDYDYLDRNINKLDSHTRNYFMNMISSIGKFYSINGEYIFLDNFIDEAVIHLNNIGIDTLYSCNGHTVELPYISIKGICTYIDNFEDYELSIHYDKNFTVLRPKYSSISDLNILNKFVDKILSIKEEDIKWN